MSTDAAPASRSDRRRLRTRRALLEAGRRLFSERGVGEVTIQEITDEADVAKGSFYNHFETREDLQRAAAAAALDEVGAANDLDLEQRESDAARIVAASLLSTLRTCLADPVLGSFLLNNADLGQFGDALLTRGRRDLSRGRRSGRFAFEDLDMLMIAIAGAGQSVLRARLRNELTVASETRFIALVLRMLGVDASEAQAIATDTAKKKKGKT